MSALKRLGFGTTKVNQESVIARAVELGIRHIDTSPRVGRAGAAQGLVGHVLKTQKYATREEITLTTKLGYYSTGDGSKPYMASLRVGGADSIVNYSLNPEFLLSDLRKSLGVMQQEYVDIAYIAQPEQYIADVVLRHGVADQSQMTQEVRGFVEEEKERVYDRLVPAFEALEGMVGKEIRGYGVSSNALSLPADDPLRLPLDLILNAANEAAKRAGRLVPSLRAIQLPYNLLEVAGEHAAKQAKAKGLDVVAIRPLTALHGGGLYRLAGKPEFNDQIGPPQGYVEATQAVLEHFVPPPEIANKKESELTEEERDVIHGCEMLRRLIQDLNQQLVHFNSRLEFETAVEQELIPMIYGTFKEFDEGGVEKLQKFFQKYSALVTHNTARKARDVVSKSYSIPKEYSLHEYALEWALLQKEISTVVVGLPQMWHIQEAVRCALKAEGGVTTEIKME